MNIGILKTLYTSGGVALDTPPTPGQVVSPLQGHTETPSTKNIHTH